MYGTSTPVFINQNTDPILLLIGPSNRTGAPGIYVYTGGTYRTVGSVQVLSATLTRISTWSSAQFIPAGTTIFVQPNVPVTGYPSVFMLQNQIIVATAQPAPIIVQQIPGVGTTTVCGTQGVPYDGQLVAYGGTLPYTFSQVGTASGGTVVINPTTGSFVFTPSVNTVGSFQYQVMDSEVPPKTGNIGTFTIDFSP